MFYYIGYIDVYTGSFHDNVINFKIATSIGLAGYAYFYRSLLKLHWVIFATLK
jgi:hypothetical protein